MVELYIPDYENKRKLPNTDLSRALDAFPDLLECTVYDMTTALEIFRMGSPLNKAHAVDYIMSKYGNARRGRISYKFLAEAWQTSVHRLVMLRNLLNMTQDLQDSVENGEIAIEDAYFIYNNRRVNLHLR